VFQVWTSPTLYVDARARARDSGLPPPRALRAASAPVCSGRCRPAWRSSPRSARHPCAGNAVTVSRVAQALGERVDLSVWDLSAAEEASIEAEIEAYAPALITRSTPTARGRSPYAWRSGAVCRSWSPARAPTRIMTSTIRTAPTWFEERAKERSGDRLPLVDCRQDRVSAAGLRERSGVVPRVRRPSPEPRRSISPRAGRCLGTGPVRAPRRHSRVKEPGVSPRAGSVGWLRSLPEIQLLYAGPALNPVWPMGCSAPGGDPVGAPHRRGSRTPR